MNQSLAQDMELFAPRKEYQRVGAASKKKDDSGARRITPEELYRRTRKAQSPVEAVKELSREEKREAQVRRAEYKLTTVAIVVIFVGVFSILLSSAQLHSVRRQISGVEKDIKAVTQENEDTRRKFEVSMSDATVKAIASQKMGLRKRERCQTVLIDLPTCDAFEYAPKSDRPNRLALGFDTISAYFN
ncbi:MAG: hypothetical protein FWE86_00685 [Oscillospiraceae bacterium]|nr:hypothetical protein [Oscillospiraceae bacterium]